MKKHIILLFTLAFSLTLFTGCEPDYITSDSPPPSVGGTGSLTINVTSGSLAGTTYTSSAQGAAVATKGELAGVVFYLLNATYKNWQLQGGFSELENNQFLAENQLAIEDVDKKIVLRSMEDQGKWSISNIRVIQDAPGTGQKIISCKIVFNGKFELQKNGETVEENLDVNGTLIF